jgi:hypothetical protein
MDWLIKTEYCCTRRLGRFVVNRSYYVSVLAEAIETMLFHWNWAAWLEQAPDAKPDSYTMSGPPPEFSSRMPNYPILDAEGYVRR